MPECSESGPWAEVLRRVESDWPRSRWRDVGVVVGCSGGADSVGLLRALAELRQCDDRAVHPRGFLIAAHYHHGLRGQAADDDETFVRRLSRQLDIQVEAGRAESVRHDEASMRAGRLTFLQDVAHRRGARYVVLGHSADDNVETVLHQLFRGSGPAGLAGIGSPRPLGRDLILVRPLLGVPRATIRLGLEQLGQVWREDASNENTAYRRNWIRHRLMPMIQDQYPEPVEAVDRAIEGWRDWRYVIDRLARQWLDSHLPPDGEPVVLRDRLTERAIVVAAMQLLWTRQQWPRRPMTRQHWIRLADTIAEDRDQRYDLPGAIDVIAAGQTVRMTRQP